MTRKPTPKPKPKHADPEQYKRFVEMAREVGADKSPEAFERAFKTVVAPLRKTKRAL